MAGTEHVSGGGGDQWDVGIWEDFGTLFRWCRLIGWMVTRVLREVWGQLLMVLDRVGWVSGSWILQVITVLKSGWENSCRRQSMSTCSSSSSAIIFSCIVWVCELVMVLDNCCDAPRIWAGF